MRVRGGRGSRTYLPPEEAWQTAESLLVEDTQEWGFAKAAKARIAPGRWLSG